MRRKLSTHWYDAYGNVMGYWDAQGNVVPETGFYYYGYRFYSPELMRWITRDPIGEEGGVNLYAMCGNNATSSVDVLGKNRYITQFDILNYGGSGGTQLHVGVAVDKWTCRNGKWEKTGVATFDFAPKPTLLNTLTSIAACKGWIYERNGLCLVAPITLSSTPDEDVMMLKMIREQAKDPPFYSPVFFNCIFWSVGAVNYGKKK